MRFVNRGKIGSQGKGKTLLYSLGAGVISGPFPKICFVENGDLKKSGGSV
jgi:hypothetical protein